jgi:cysteine-rich repeat protein
MRNLAWLAIVLGTGCMQYLEDEDEPPYCGDGIVNGEETCDDGNYLSGDGCAATCGVAQPLTVGWRITTLAGASQSCAPAYDTAKIWVQPFEAGQCDAAPCPDVATGPVQAYVAPCTAGGVVLGPVSASIYQVSVQIKYAVTERLFGESLPIRVVSSEAPRAYAVFYADAGYARLRWQLRDATGTDVGCGTGIAAIDSVAATFTPEDGGEPFTQSFACAAGTAVSQPVPAGVYTISLQARDRAGEIGGVRIDDHNAVTEPAMIILAP